MKKYLFLLAACFFCGSLFFATGTGLASGREIAQRGVVEGFYGKPWSQAERLEILSFMGRQGLNTYVYAPKDDPYHRERWRDPYPEEQRTQLKQLVAAARKQKVEFVFALSPGLDIRLHGVEAEADLQALLSKYNTLYDLGVRQFALFFDDIKHKDGRGQAALLHQVNRLLVHGRPGVKTLWTVPTEYFTEDMVKDGEVKPYTRSFAQHLDRDIQVMYTGPEVVSEEISPQDIKTVEAIYHRKPVVWWNYPANDYLPGKLALGPVYGLSKGAASHMAGFLMNPMEQARLSRLALATGAAYARDPAGYLPEQSWHKALVSQYGPLAGSMQVLAEHSQRMENDWARAGRADAGVMQKQMKEFWRQASGCKNLDPVLTADLRREFEQMQSAAAKLQQGLPPETLQECQLQVELLKQLGTAGQTVLQLVGQERQGKAFSALRSYNALLKQRVALPDSKKARLSEQTGRKFIEEGKVWYEKRHLPVK